jgi:ubiquinone/menaquinone biosynthesis C-methylase UbiE
VRGDGSGYAGKKVLDVGCGVGNDLSRFARGGAEVTGIDLAEHSIELAADNFRFRELEGDFRVMNGEQMTFANDTFDLVYCHTVLHFTPRPEQMVEEIYRVLKPGGLAIIMTVNRRSWLNFLHKLMKVEIDHLDAPVFRMYTIAEFKQLLRPFLDVNIVPERFPVATKVHGGVKATLFNKVFVGSYNLLPTVLTHRTGHHLLAFARKPDADA